MGDFFFFSRSRILLELRIPKMAVWKPGLYRFTSQRWAGLSRLLGGKISAPALGSPEPSPVP